MSDEVFVSTKLVGNIRIDLGNRRVVTPDSALKISKAELMAISGVDRMLKSGKLVIMENLAPVAPVEPVAPPKEPEAPVEQPKEQETPKKTKKVRGVQADAVVIDEVATEPEVVVEQETPAESTEPKE